MVDFKFCPVCGNPLNPIVIEGKSLLACTGATGVKRCGKYVHWNNPVPCVAVLCPVVKLDKAELHRLGADFNPAKPNAVILVQRGINPGKGKWCLPCGYVNAWEDPRDAAHREVREETGLVIELMQLLLGCKAHDQDLNNLILFYMARVVGGEEAHGDDAISTGWFRRDELPELAFETHLEIINDFFEGRWPYTGNLSAKIRLN